MNLNLEIFSELVCGMHRRRTKGGGTAPVYARNRFHSEGAATSVIAFHSPDGSGPFAGRFDPKGEWRRLFTEEISGQYLILSKTYCKLVGVSSARHVKHDEKALLM